MQRGQENAAEGRKGAEQHTPELMRSEDENQVISGNGEAHEMGWIVSRVFAMVYFFSGTISAINLWTGYKG